ncbi:MAG TPA: hypothetical protein VJM80_07395 [bacterium]|nr:hypothetical protein [bacterium]
MRENLPDNAAPLREAGVGSFSKQDEGRTTVETAPIPGTGWKPTLWAIPEEVDVNWMLRFRVVFFHTLREAPFSSETRPVDHTNTMIT